MFASPGACSIRRNMSVTTGRWVSAWKERGATKRVAASVMMTSTFAPAFTSWLARSTALYAAMQPVIPSTMFLLASNLDSLVSIPVEVVEHPQSFQRELRVHDLDERGLAGD